MIMPFFTIIDVTIVVEVVIATIFLNEICFKFSFFCAVCFSGGIQSLQWYFAIKVIALLILVHQKVSSELYESKY